MDPLAGAPPGTPQQEMYARCNDGHCMVWANFDPYGGEGVTCD